jgi:hypothetical protein
MSWLVAAVNLLAHARLQAPLRATRPNEYWHLDVTIIRLLDGTNVYMHAVIDKPSRRILSWNVAFTLSPRTRAPGCR